MNEGTSRSETTHEPQISAPEPTDKARLVRKEVTRLGELDIHGLRVRWRQLFRKKAPEHLSRNLLFRIVAYWVQANAFGDLDRETARLLDRIGKQLKAGVKKPVPPLSKTGTLKPGCQLIREYEGQLHRVVVLAKGFEWNRKSYGSLSEVARAITGTQWNGPRFFGLRDRARRESRGGEA